MGGTFRAPSAASSSSAASSLSPASVPPPMSTGVILPRPGILKTAPASSSSNTVIEFQNSVPHPDVAQASSGIGHSSVPNSVNNRPTSILKHGQALPPSNQGFNSSCQECIAE